MFRLLATLLENLQVRECSGLVDGQQLDPTLAQKPRPGLASEAG